ncbi:MAG: type IV pilus modification protein PilV [Burkholderiales bacterium]|nr:MAG: type IV pilus modification protein PilV [Burkholderiales bacterium]
MATERRTGSRRRSAGLSLIEVLVSMVISAIGLMGLIGLQVGSMRSAKSAHLLSAANLLVGDMADRMRANAGGHRAPLTYAQAGTWSSVAGDVPAETACADEPRCTAAERIREDLAAWQRAIAAALPEGGGVVLGAPDVGYQVVIGWRERSATVEAQAANGGCPAAFAAPTNVRCLVVSVRP